MLPLRRRNTDSHNCNSSNNIESEHAFGSSTGSSNPSDPDLARIVAAWPKLPDAIRAAMLALLPSAAATPGNAPAAPGKAKKG